MTTRSSMPLLFEKSKPGHRGADFPALDVPRSAQLLPQIYDFVFWADFVDAATTAETAAGADKFYNTNEGSLEIGRASCRERV